MDPITMENGSKIRLLEEESTFGKMDVAIMVNGITIICMDTVFTSTQMESDMMASIRMIKRKVMEFINGLMVVSTVATGI